MPLSKSEIVFIVSGNSNLREEIRGLVIQAGLRAVPLGTAAEYAAYRKPRLPACVVLDLELPDTSALDLQDRMAETDGPVVFVARDGDVSCSVRAIKAGAIDFLTTPLNPEDLLRAVHIAIAQDRETRLERERHADLQQRFARLTRREHQVMQLVVSGFLNKQAAVELGISEITVQIHRGRTMQKMGARSFADLVRMASILNLPLAGSDLFNRERVNSDIRQFNRERVWRATNGGPN